MVEGGGSSSSPVRSREEFADSFSANSGEKLSGLGQVFGDDKEEGERDDLVSSPIVLGVDEEHPRRSRHGCIVFPNSFTSASLVRRQLIRLTVTVNHS